MAWSATAVLLALLLFGSVASAEANVTSREQAVALYEQGEIDRDVPTGWTGSVDGCVIGSESEASVDATFRTINAVRTFAGIPTVEENEAMSHDALAAALIMEAAGPNVLEHEVDESWECWTPEGGNGAAHSNLSRYGPSGSDGIWSYLEEGPDFGHRLNVLDPGLFEMGTGSTGGTNVNYVIGGYRDGQRVDAMEPDSAVAWPPAGWFPADWLPKGEPFARPPQAGWFSIALGNAGNQERISAAGAEVSVELDGEPVALQAVSRGLDANVYGIGKPIGFQPKLPSSIAYGDHTIDVEITGVTLRGQPFAVAPYTIQTFGSDEPPPPDPDCERARTKLASAQAALERARRSGKKAKVRRAKAQVSSARAGVRAAC